MSKYYLIEPTDVSNTGAIKGKTLRAYEVELNGKGKWGSPKVKGTGKMFMVQDGKIITKKSTAKLNSKNIGWNKPEIYDRIDNSVSYWRSSLFISPELALAAKSSAIEKIIADKTQEFTSYITALKTAKKSLPDTSFIKQDYPELFV